MKPKLLIRIAAGLLLFFAAGHSIGHTQRHGVEDPKAKEVLQIMSDYKYDMFGEMRSYEENYSGMSLNLICTLLAFAAILWVISNGLTNKKQSMVLLIPIVLCVFAFSITGFVYFFPLPAITCLITSIILVAAIVLLNRQSQKV
jgi:hypothetical protein